MANSMPMPSASNDSEPLTAALRLRAGLPLSAPFRWFSLGLADLHYAPGPSLFYGVCISALGALMLYSVRHAVAIAAATSTGFILLGPFLALGLCELSRRRELRLPCVLAPTLSSWRRNGAAIGIFSMVLLVLYLLWARASLIVFALFYSGGLPTMEILLRQASNLENLDFLLAYGLVGGFFATLAFAASAISLPLILDRSTDAVTAMLASVQAIRRNPLAMSVWALVIVAMVFIGIGTSWIGLVVTMPIVGHGTWHAYRSLVEAPSETEQR